MRIREVPEHDEIYHNGFMTEILASSDGMEKLLKEKRPRLDKQLEIEELPLSVTA